MDNNKSVYLFLIHLFNLCLIILLGLFAVKSAGVTPCQPSFPGQGAQDPASLCMSRTHALYAWSSRWRRVDAAGSDSGCLLAPQPRGSRRRMRRPVRATPTHPSPPPQPPQPPLCPPLRSSFSTTLPYIRVYYVTGYSFLKAIC